MLFASLDPTGNESLLQKMRAQHHLQRKRRPAGAALGVIQRNQRSSKNDVLYLLQKSTLVGSLWAQIKVQYGLLQALYFFRLALHQSH